MSFELKKKLLNLESKRLGLSVYKDCSMIKADACNTYDPYCKRSGERTGYTLCTKKIGGPKADDKFYNSIHIDDLNIPFISPELIFTFEKELSDIFLMEHARMYVENREEYERLMNATIYDNHPNDNRPERTFSDLKPKQYDQKLRETVEIYRSTPHVARVFEPKIVEKIKKSKILCGAIRAESCHKYKTHCVQDSKLGECRKIRGGPELDDTFEKTIDPQDILENKPKRVSKESTYNPMLTYGEPADLGPLPAPRWNNSSAAVAAIPVPSSANLVVSDLPKSNSGVAKTEEVMEQVMAANVSKGLLSRQKSVEILASPAAQHYVDLREKFTKGNMSKLDKAMLTVHDGVEKILKNRSEGTFTAAEEKAELQKLFDDNELCEYVKGKTDKRQTIPELTDILNSFGEVDKKVRQAGTRSTICYIILSVVLMDPKTFIEKLSGINKGAYSKK